MVGCGSDSIKTAGANEEGDVGKTEGSRAGAEASLAVLSGAEQEEEDKYGKVCDGVVRRGLRLVEGVKVEEEGKGYEVGMGGGRVFVVILGELAADAKVIVSHCIQ